MVGLHILYFLLLSLTALGAYGLFSVHDDLLAFPQYQIHFPESYATEDEASEKLEYMSSISSKSKEPTKPSDPVDASKQTFEIETKPRTPSDGGMSVAPPKHGKNHDPVEITWEVMWMQDRRFLCSLPVVQPPPKLNATEKKKSRHEEEKELARATTRGLELLQKMDGSCIFFISGWWSYSFCHNDKIRQFHQIPPANGVPLIPPVEDKNTPAYVLGRAANPEFHEGKGHNKQHTAEMQTNGELKYLVQKLGGGTKCDITGKDRRIEIQYHCQPHAINDKIGYIKEVTTCCYLMVVYTRKLCEDPAFLPPKQDRAHGVECREIMNAKQIENFKAEQRQKAEQEETLIKLLSGMDLKEKKKKDNKGVGAKLKEGGGEKKKTMQKVTVEGPDGKPVELDQGEEPAVVIVQIEQP